MIEDPTFWVALGFAAFIGVLVWAKVPGMIGKGLDGRAEKIKSDIEETEKLREEAQKLLADFQKRQREAQKEADGIVKAAREEAERLAKSGRERLEASLARREKLAMDRIAQAEAAAMAEVRARTIDVAMAATRTALSESVKGKKASALIDEAVKGLGERLL